MDYYLFTGRWEMDGWVGHVGWPIADGLTTEWSPIWRRIGKVCQPRPAFSPLCYAATNHWLWICNNHSLSWLSLFTFSALTLLVGCQKGHLACKNIAPSIPKGTSLGGIQGIWPSLEWSPEISISQSICLFKEQNKKAHIDWLNKENENSSINY